MIKVIQNYNINDIKEGILHQLHVAAHSPEVRQHAIEITANKQDKISAIYDWVKNNVAYIPDPINIELFMSPRKLIEQHNGGMAVGEDCDGHAMLLTALYRSIGIEAHTYLVDCIGEGLDHALCIVWSDKLQEWIHVDTTTDHPLGWIIEYQEGVTV